MFNLQSSHEDTSKQKEILTNEVQLLRGDLQQVREERDKNREQVETLTAEIVRYKEYTGRSIAELDNLTVKSNDLEVLLSSPVINYMFQTIDFIHDCISVITILMIQGFFTGKVFEPMWPDTDFAR